MDLDGTGANPILQLQSPAGLTSPQGCIGLVVITAMAGPPVLGLSPRAATPCSRAGRDRHRLLEFGQLEDFCRSTVDDEAGDADCGPSEPPRPAHYAVLKKTSLHGRKANA